MVLKKSFGIRQRYVSFDKAVIKMCVIGKLSSFTKNFYPLVHETAI